MLVHVGSQDQGLCTPSRYLARMISGHACELLVLLTLLLYEGLCSPYRNGATMTDLSADPAAFEQHPLFHNLRCVLHFECTVAAEAAANKQGQLNDQPIFKMQAWTLNT